MAKQYPRSASVPDTRAPAPIDSDVALLDLGGGAFDEVPFAEDPDVGTHVKARAQSIHIRGITYSHTGEDGHGRWIYRRM